MNEPEKIEEKVKKAPLLPNGGYPMHSFEQLRELFYTYIKNPDDRKMVEDAYRLADQKHDGHCSCGGAEKTDEKADDPDADLVKEGCACSDADYDPEEKKEEGKK